MNENQRLLTPVATAASWLLVLAGLSTFVSALFSAPERAWGAFLVSGFYALGLCLAGAVFLAIRTLVTAGWCGLFLRVPEAMARLVPFFGVALCLTFAGFSTLYHHGHGVSSLAKAHWLSGTARGIRSLVVLALWTVLARRLTIPRPETDLVAAWSARVRAAAAFALVFAPTFTIFSIDWLMSLEPHWSSTLYPWYAFSTIFAGGLAALTLLALAAGARGMAKGLSSHHRHDLGKLVFAFSFFWGYLWFCQYLLIWYANIPEEVTHYLARTTPAWLTAFCANAAINLIVPFLALLPADAKRSAPWLAASSAVVVAGHWLDLHLLVMPALAAAGPAFTLVDAGVAAGFAGAFLLAVDTALGAGSITAESDPFLAESLAHHG